MRFAVIILLAITLSGCAGFEQFIDALNNRDGLSSCMRYQGSMRVAGGHVAINGVTVTGGATLVDCMSE